MCFNTVRVVLGTTIVTLSALYFVVLVEPENQMVTVSRKVRFNVMKAWLDKSNQTQMERKEHIQKVCQKYGFKEAHTWAYLSTISPIYTQNLIPKAFLRMDNPSALACYNHKVASNSWMALFAKQQDPQLWARLNQTRQFYLTWKYLSPKTRRDLVQSLTSGHYFTFAIVRHPLDRLLSAYRDKFVDQPCKWQANHYVPLILKLTRPSQKFKLSDIKNTTTNCIKITPSFFEFVEYVIQPQSKPDSHWFPMTKQCAPCLVDYDAIVKLETVHDDENWVFHQLHFHSLTNTKHLHKTKGNGSDLDVRKKFYSDIECRQIHRLVSMYKMDLEVFDYDPGPFFELCKKNLAKLTNTGSSNQSTSEH